MIRATSRRRLVSLLLAASLAILGGVVAAVPASAAPGTLTIDPVVPTNRSVTITGTGTDGGVIAASNVGESVVGQATVADGVWGLTLEFPIPSSAAQTVTVTQTVAEFADDPDQETVDFTLPEVIPTGVISVVDPDATEPLSSPVVTFTGTAPVGSTLFVDDEGAVGPQPAPVTQNADGSFSYLAVLLGDFETDETFTFTGTDSAGTPLVPAEVTVTVPPAIAVPVILSPRTGSVLVAPQVTLSGTGVPGELVQLRVIPADPATLEANGGGGDGGPLLARLRVAEDGTWSTTYGANQIASGNYEFSSYHTTGGVRGDLDFARLSGDSNTVSFSINFGEQQLAATG